MSKRDEFRHDYERGAIMARKSLGLRDDKAKDKRPDDDEDEDPDNDPASDGSADDDDKDDGPKKNEKRGAEYFRKLAEQTGYIGLKRD